MKKQEKIWIVFLAHLYYEIDRKMKFHFNRNISLLTPILSMWDQLGPELIAKWKDGEKYVNCSTVENLLTIDYNSYMPNDIFIRAFGVEIQREYVKAIYMNLAKITYRTDNTGTELLFFDERRNFYFKDDKIIPFQSKHFENGRNKEYREKFDQGFLNFFKEHIGLDFSKAENFFEVYLRSKLNTK